MRKFLGHYLIALSLLLPIPALAQTAVTMRAVNVRTGPDPAFPLVTRLQARTPVHDEEFQARSP
jgi:uncharacterized protein YraI